MVRTAIVIPDNERCQHEPRASADLQAALAHAASNPASQSKLTTYWTAWNRDEP